MANKFVQNKGNIAFCYYRYSSSVQRDCSIEQQRDAAHKLADEHGYKIEKEYEDRAISGTRDDRPGLQMMLFDIQRLRPAYLILWKVDRLARDNKLSVEDYYSRIGAPKEQLDAVFASFIGKSQQIPPIYSAIKVNGVPMYKAARSGKEVELKPRDIEIYSLTGTIENNIIKFTAKVSKGTYIRTLGEDIANKLGTVGHLEELRRTEIGNIKVSDAKHIDDILDEDIISGIDLINLPRIELNEKGEERAKNGQRLFFKTSHDKVLLTKDNNLIAVYTRKEEDVFISERGLF